MAFVMCVVAAANTVGTIVMAVGRAAPWVLTAELTASNAGPRDEFGHAVAMSGNTIVVGARYEDSAGTCGSDNSLSNAGAAYVYVKTGASWQFEACLKGSAPRPVDFGSGVAIDRDTIAVASPHSSRVHVFTRTGGVWTEQAVLGPTAEFEDPISLGLGEDGSLALTGDTLVVGGRRFNNGQGVVFVFVRAAAQWTLQATLRPAVPNSFRPYFGYGVAMSGETVIVGAHGEDSGRTDSGAAYIFVRSGSTWTEQAVLKAPAPTQSFHFGWDVAIAGNTALVSAPGAAGLYTYVRTGTAWALEATLDDGPGVGHAVSLVNDVAYATVRAGGVIRAFVRSNGAWTAGAANGIGPFNCGCLDVAATADVIVGGARDGGASFSDAPGRAFVFEPEDGSAGLVVSPAQLRFSGIAAGAAAPLTSLTPAQSVAVDFSRGTPAWQSTTDQPWLRVTPSSGTGDAAITVSVVNPGNVLAGATDVTATITVTAPDLLAEPRRVAVRLEIDRSARPSQPPFGQVDTPLQGATGLQGAIAVTGWALDDVGVARVQVYRSCLSFDGPVNCQHVLGHNVVYIGDVSILEGARPDVAAVYGSLVPGGTRAGWGLLLLTPTLPDVIRQELSGGVGGMSLVVVATDVEGQRAVLGRTSDPSSSGFGQPTDITLANNTLAKPFGTIDTPAPGATVSGTLYNFGWALTPDTNTVRDAGDIYLVRVDVIVDGIPIGAASRNQCRGSPGALTGPMPYCDDDVSNTFGQPRPEPTFTPRTSNPTRFRDLDAFRGSIASFALDTTRLSNGPHTIAWSVMDVAGRTEGIGSRVFIVLNNSDSPVESAASRAGPATPAYRIVAGSDPAFRD